MCPAEECSPMKYKIFNARGQHTTFGQCLSEAESLDVTIDQFYVETAIADR
jgi:hypothetical protein